ncbi:MAG: hypothetical protein ACW99U_19655 [Candidatus Thorarchaeota archaeon]
MSTISPAIWRDLTSFPRGTDLTWPAAVRITDGRHYPRVLFVEKNVYHRKFRGCYGMDDAFIPVESVELVTPSPSKTPIAVEKEMYAHHETHMGGYVVKFRLSDGTIYWHTSGNFLEFVSVPKGYQAEDVAEVIFPAFEEYAQKPDDSDIHLMSPDWKWCVFEPLPP